jgi:hypothetical protein
LVYPGIEEELEQICRLRRELLSQKIEDPREKRRRMSALLDPKVTEILEKLEAK